MQIKQFLRTRKSVLAKPFNAVLVAVLPANAVMKVELKVSNKEKKTTVENIINKRAEDAFKKSMDELIDATEEVISWQAVVENQTIEAGVSTSTTPIEIEADVSTSTASVDIEEPEIVEVASQPIPSEEEIAKLRTYFWRAIIEGPNGKPFTSLTTGSLNSDVDSERTSPFAYSFLPPTTCYLALKERFEYHCTRVAEHPEDPVALAKFNDFQYRIYFPDRA